MRPLAWFLGGLDPSGGAGLLLDARVANAHHVAPRTLATLLTAQADGLLVASEPVPPGWLERQAEALLRVEGAPAVLKAGALASGGQARWLADLARRLQRPLVLDPVLRASAGAPLGQADLPAALREALLPATTVLTPNVPEAERLLDRTIATTEEATRAAEALAALGPPVVLLKGGHLPGPPHDVLLADGRVEVLEHARLPGQVRGTGCALASALAARLARGASPHRAARGAVDWLQRALRLAERQPSGAAHLAALPPAAVV